MARYGDRFSRLPVARNVERLMGVWSLVSLVGWVVLWDWLSAESWGAWTWLPIAICCGLTWWGTAVLYRRWMRPRRPAPPDYTYRGWA